MAKGVDVDCMDRQYFGLSLGLSYSFLAILIAVIIPAIFFRGKLALLSGVWRRDLSLLVDELRVNTGIVLSQSKSDELKALRDERQRVLAETFKNIARGGDFIEFGDIFYQVPNRVVTVLQNLEEIYCWPAGEGKDSAEETNSRWVRWRYCFDTAATRCRERRIRDRFGTLNDPRVPLCDTYICIRALFKRWMRTRPSAKVRPSEEGQEQTTVAESGGGADEGEDGAPLSSDLRAGGEEIQEESQDNDKDHDYPKVDLQGFVEFAAMLADEDAMYRRNRIFASGLVFDKNDAEKDAAPNTIAAFHRFFQRRAQRRNIRTLQSMSTERAAKMRILFDRYSISGTCGKEQTRSKWWTYGILTPSAKMHPSEGEEEQISAPESSGAPPEDGDLADDIQVTPCIVYLGHENAGPLHRAVAEAGFSVASGAIEEALCAVKGHEVMSAFKMESRSGKHLSMYISFDDFRRLLAVLSMNSCLEESFRIEFCRDEGGASINGAKRGSIPVNMVTSFFKRVLVPTRTSFDPELECIIAEHESEGEIFFDEAINTVIFLQNPVRSLEISWRFISLEFLLRREIGPTLKSIGMLSVVFVAYLLFFFFQLIIDIYLISESMYEEGVRKKLKAIAAAFKEFMPVFYWPFKFSLLNLMSWVSRTCTKQYLHRREDSTC